MSERGRDPIVSTGRGGAGNLVRSQSRGVDPEATAGNERGREFFPRELSGDRVTHAGRGGAGNIRSPSRDPKREKIAEAEEEALQDKLIADRRGRQAEQPFSSGRGGVGNISNSRSRSRSKARSDKPREESRTRGHLLHPVHSGRGGYGNISEEKKDEDLERIALEQRYEAEVKKKHEEEEAGHQHPVGRGGAGSVGQTFTPVDLSTLTLEEREAYHKVHEKDSHLGINTGRGGAGNILPAEDRGRNGGHSGMLGSVLRSLSRAAGRDHSREPKTVASRDGSRDASRDASRDGK